METDVLVVAGGQFIVGRVPILDWRIHMQKLLGLIVGMMMVAGVSFGANSTPVNADIVAADHHHGIWHCTAYPRGSHHHHGFSARDEHRSHAERKAVNRCERATGRHCHHVDCHKDHHDAN